MKEDQHLTVHYFLRGAILFAFALFIVILVRTDTLLYYIAPRMSVYVKWSAMGLYAISVYQIYLGIKSLNGTVHSCDCHDHNPPSRSAFKNVIVYGLFIFPLLLGFILPNNVMGSAMAAKKGVNLNSSALVKTNDTLSLGNSEPALEVGLQESNELDSPDESKWSQDELQNLFEYDIFTEFYAKFGMQLYQEEVIVVEEDIYIETLTTLDLFSDTFVGKKIRLHGFVYREDTMNEHQFVVARFAIHCCSADASPYGVLVNYEDAQHIAEDEWVIVEGTIHKTTFNDFDIIEVHVDSVEKTLEPISPYVYPNYEFELE